MHRRNAAERAIQTCKDHFLVCLANVDPEFPITEWDRLLPQASITLNLLRNSRMNPKLSAYAYLFGNFDFNATPLAPPGTKVIIHEKADKPASWGLHGRDGFYIGPSMEHYRCVKCFIPATNKKVDTDTVEFIPYLTPIPKTSTEDHLNQAVSDILAILQQQQKALPFRSSGDGTLNAIEQIAKLLQRATTKHEPKLPQPIVPPPLRLQQLSNEHQKQAPSPAPAAPSMPVPTTSSSAAPTNTTSSSAPFSTTVSPPTSLSKSTPSSPK